MKRSILIASFVASGLLFAASINSQTVTSDMVGFVQPFNTTGNQINCLGNSDTKIAIPFTRPPEFVGATTAAGSNTLTVSGSPWGANQFQYNAGANQHNTYFVLIGPHSSTNPKEGRMYQITSNTANQLTVNNGGDDLSGVAAGTQILVIPYHTLSSIFPASDAGVSFLSSGSTFIHPTEILIPNYAGVGTNLSTGATYFFYNGHWRKVGESGFPDRDDDALPNAGHFTVRNTTATGTTMTTLGSVLTKKVTIPLVTRANGQQDNFVSVIRPVDVALSDLGLISSGAFQPSTSTFIHTDELLVFAHAPAQQNRSAAATYFFYSGGDGAHWRKVGDSGFPNRDADVIPAGDGFVIRKGATAGGPLVYWTNAPTY
ncbi:MAG TPA: TIGR02597 family protein [Chthoniobacterales bacterium]